MDNIEQIRYALRKYTDLSIVEDVLDQCKAEGVSASVWSVGAASRCERRRLTRQPPEPSREAVLHDLAVTFLGFHDTVPQRWQVRTNSK
jgi:hypothetical protein